MYNKIDRKIASRLCWRYIITRRTCTNVNAIIQSRLSTLTAKRICMYISRNILSLFLRVLIFLRICIYMYIYLIRKLNYLVIHLIIDIFVNRKINEWILEWILEYSKLYRINEERIKFDSLFGFEFIIRRMIHVKSN